MRAQVWHWPVDNILVNPDERATDGMCCSQKKPLHLVHDYRLNTPTISLQLNWWFCFACYRIYFSFLVFLNSCFSNIFLFYCFVYNTWEKVKIKWIILNEKKSHENFCWVKKKLPFNLITSSLALSLQNVTNFEMN